MPGRFIIAFMLFMISFHSAVVAQQTPGQFSPLNPAVVLGMTYNRLTEIKGQGEPQYGRGDEVNQLKSVVYYERWFNYGEPVPVTYRLMGGASGRVDRITLRYPNTADRARLIKNISSYLGAPSLERPLVSSASVYQAVWNNNGLRYNLEDYGSYMALTITPATFGDYARYGLPADTLLLDQTEGNVTGKGTQRIRLLGRRFEPGAAINTGLAILVSDQLTGRSKLVNLPENAGMGYEPGMRLYDFNGDRLKDIFIYANTGGSGGISNYVIYSFANMQPVVLFNSAASTIPTFTTSFLPNYRASIRVNETGKTYTLDLMDRKAYYDELGLYRDGQLLKPQEKPFSGGYALLKPVDVDRDGVYELQATQQIAGAANVDRIANVVSVLDFKGGRWVVASSQVTKIPTS